MWKVYRSSPICGTFQNEWCQMINVLQSFRDVCYGSFFKIFEAAISNRMQFYCWYEWIFLIAT